VGERDHLIAVLGLSCPASTRRHFPNDLHAIRAFIEPELSSSRTRFNGRPG